MRSTVQKDFYNTIGHKRIVTEVASEFITWR